MAMGAETFPSRTRRLKARPARSRSPYFNQQIRGRKPLKLHQTGGLIDPIDQLLILRPGEEFADGLIGDCDIGRVPRQGHPTERARPLAEEGADIGQDKAGNSEGLLHARLIGPLPEIISVIEDMGPSLLKIQHGLNVEAHGVETPLPIGLGVGLAELPGLIRRQALGDIAVQGVVGRGLVGHQIGEGPFFQDITVKIGGVALGGNGTRPPLGFGV